MKLLVSVRNVEEARSALCGGADVIDVKEPRNGPLGMADGGVIAAVADAVWAEGQGPRAEGEEFRAESREPRAKGQQRRAQSRCKGPIRVAGVDQREPPDLAGDRAERSIPVSAALGEVLDWRERFDNDAPTEGSERVTSASHSLRSRQIPPLTKGGPGGVTKDLQGSIQCGRETDGPTPINQQPQAFGVCFPPTLDLVKLGPAGLAGERDWACTWLGTRRRLETLLPAECGWVAVAYADWCRARAPRPREILDAVVRGRLGPCRGFLIDTFRKDGRGLFDWMAVEELETLTVAARSAGVLTALAGSLSFKDIARLHELRPDVVAVRGAVCHSADRTSAVREELVREFAGRLDALKGGSSELPLPTDWSVPTS